MPIRTCYKIFSATKTAPKFTTHDRVMAYVEFNELIRNPKGDVYRLEQTPEPDGALTKSEEYLLLVYRVRRLMRQYFDRGRQHQDLIVSLEHEKRLDDWNKRTQAFIDSHPGYKPADEKSHAFYVLVSEWRKTWRERKNYSKRTMGYDQRIMDEMTRKCRALEKEIDKTVKERLQLL